MGPADSEGDENVRQRIKVTGGSLTQLKCAGVHAKEWGQTMTPGVRIDEYFQAHLSLRTGPFAHFWP